MQQTANPTAQRAWRKSLFNNLLWFVGCLALAFLVWLTATTQADPVIEWRLTERVPIRVQPDDGLIVTNAGTLTSTASVYLRGPQSGRPLITSEDVIVTAAIAGLGPGTYVVPLQAQVSGTARVANISPSQITVTLEVEAAKFVPVRDDILEPPPPDIEVVAITADVLQVEVRGPQSLVEAVVAAELPLDLSSQRAPFELDVRLVPVDVDDDVVADMTVTPPVTRVRVELQASATVREVAVRPQLVGELPDGYFLTAIDYNPQTIYVSVPVDGSEDIPNTVFTAPIDLSERTESFSVSVPVELPEGNLVPISGTDVSVSIGVEAQIVTRQFDAVPIELSGRRQGFEYSVDPAEVTVVLTGPQPIIDNLSVDELHVTADVISLTAEGAYRVALTALLTQNNDVVEASILPPDALVAVIVPAESTPEATPSSN
jgi:YbbR domain-containing protein